MTKEFIQYQIHSRKDSVVVSMIRANSSLTQNFCYKPDDWRDVPRLNKLKRNLKRTKSLSPDVIYKLSRQYNIPLSSLTTSEVETAKIGLHKRVNYNRIGF